MLPDVNTFRRSKMFRRSKKAKMEVSYFIAIALGIILLFVVGFFIIYKKIGGTAGAAMPLCNTPIQKCACFFRGDKCPDFYSSMTRDSMMCPPDNWGCDDNTYSDLLKRAKDQDVKGTCCQGPTGTISPVRLKSYRTGGEESLCGNGIVDSGEECDEQASLTECGGRQGYFTCGTPGTANECMCIPYQEPTASLPSATPEIHVDFSVFESEVIYKFNRGNGKWQYNDGDAWVDTSTTMRGLPIRQLTVARSLSFMNEPTGYAYLNNVATQADITGLPS